MCKNLSGQHPLREEIWPPKKSILAGSTWATVTFFVSGPKFTKFISSNVITCFSDAFPPWSVPEIFAIEVCSCHLAKFHGDRSTELGDFARKAIPPKFTPKCGAHIVSVHTFPTICQILRQSVEAARRYNAVKCQKEKKTSAVKHETVKALPQQGGLIKYNITHQI